MSGAWTLITATLLWVGFHSLQTISNFSLCVSIYYTTRIFGALFRSVKRTNKFVITQWKISPLAFGGAGTTPQKWCEKQNKRLCVVRAWRRIHRIADRMLQRKSDCEEKDETFAMVMWPWCAEKRRGQTYKVSLFYIQCTHTHTHIYTIYILPCSALLAPAIPYILALGH